MYGVVGRRASKAVALAVAFSLSGCASIVSKSSWPVTIQTNPSGAKCVVSKESGIQLHTGETPMTIPLESGDGFFQRAKYSITCEKAGYQTATANAASHFNGWYLGNIVFGGLIGILIVDPATGAMYRMDDTQVVKLYSNTAEGRKENSESLNLQGLEYFKNGDLNTALSYFDKAIAITPNYAKALDNKGLCLSKLGEFEPAVENLNRAIGLDPSCADTYKHRGDLFVSAGKPEKALEDFDKAISLNPTFSDALFSRGKLFLEQSKVEQGKADLSLACKQGNDRACHFGSSAESVMALRLRQISKGMI
jgi:tetratricopeptide (TPR) repeat protein